MIDNSPHSDSRRPDEASNSFEGLSAGTSQSLAYVDYARLTRVATGYEVELEGRFYGGIGFDLVSGEAPGEYTVLESALPNY